MQHVMKKTIAAMALCLGLAVSAPAFASTLTQAAVDDMSVEQLRSAFNDTTETLRELVADLQMGDDFGADFDAEKADLVREKEEIETQSAEYDTLYDTLHDDMDDYAAKCVEGDGVSGDALKECTEEHMQLSLRKTKIDEGYAELGERKEAHNAKIDKIKSRENIRTTKMDTLDDEIAGHRADIKLIEAELDSRSWAGCIDNDLCERARRAQLCTSEVNFSKDCAAQCLQNVLDGTDLPGCIR